MSTATLLLAFSAGMVAAVNPCGFALLPAYLAYYLGLESSGDADDAPPRGGELGRSLAVSGAMTAGVVLVFGLIGAVWSGVSEVVGQRLPWVIVVLGIALVFLGIAMVAGYVPMIRVPKLATTSGSQSAWSAFVFGVSYGVASLSCTIGPFIGTVTTTFRRHDFVTGLGTLVIYGLGMGAIITVLTLAVSFAHHGVVTRLRRLLPHMGRISGVLLIVSGLVATYYGWYEARILTGGSADNAFCRDDRGMA
ncbi:MAG: cytochrome c biogenesis CcdA family protein [Microthrixaceae bacterium]